MTRTCRVMVFAIIVAASSLHAADDHAVVRMIRAYGGTNEFRPPVVAIQAPGSIDAPDITQQFATVEFDVSADNIPNLYARIVHCAANWEESSNGFLNDVTNRTSLFEWTLAPARATYVRYRGKLRLPNEQLTIRFPGNWKVQIYDLDTDSVLAETKIFVVLPLASASMNFMTDFYEPAARVSGIALTLETVVKADPRKVLDNFVHTAVTYRNHRWSEPWPATTTLGMLAGGKVFRIERIPAENEYRVLDLSNTGMFPSTGQPVRLPMSDQRRNGWFAQRADDGAMSTLNVSSADDEYIPVEFLLDPAPGRPSDNDVFIAGSFNGWKPDRTWQMYYDEELRLYRLRQWVRRARHNYLYATGTYVVDDGTIRGMTYEEFEGNTASAGHGFVTFVYARMQEYGGYDGIVAVTTSNIYLSGR